MHSNITPPRKEIDENRLKKTKKNPKGATNLQAILEVTVGLIIGWSFKRFFLLCANNKDIGAEYKPRRRLNEELES